MNENGILDVDGLCEYLKTSRSTVYKLAQSAMVPAHKVGRLWRFNVDEIDKWLRSQSGASALAAFREAEAAVGELSATDGSAWERTLANVGFSSDQIETLRAFSFDSPSKIMTTMATKAGRVGLCKALKLSEDKLDAIAGKLVALMNEGR